MYIALGGSCSVLGIKLSKALILCAGSKMEESACMFASKAKIVHYDINIVKLPFFVLLKLE